MKITELSIKNYKSIAEIDCFKISSFQSILGENNSGKSNILSAIEVFLSAGSGGVKPEDFHDKSKRIIIKIKFIISQQNLKKNWKPYLLNGELILEKQIWIEVDSKTEKETIKNEFHGYQAEPKEWFLSERKIKEKKGDRPKWKDIVDEYNLPDYFLENGSCNANIYRKGLSKYILENEIEYDGVSLSFTQALGLPSNVIASLPKFYLLKAITDYSEEIDKRASNTTFRKLMGDLSERVLKLDPEYKKIEKALSIIEELLNDKKKENESAENRLTKIGVIEDKIKSLLVRLMPSVEKVSLKVLTDDLKTIFSKGVELKIDDGIETDVLMKGHGLQRCIVFSLIQTLILNERNELINSDLNKIEDNPILLAIEEPELYIHPQLGKLFYDVLHEFGDLYQVIYTTHSPRFIDVYENENIAIVSKTKRHGTKIKNSDTSAFSGLVDRKIFQGLSQLNTDVNELFFAKNVIVAEGPEDKVAITETCKKLRKIKVRTEEIDVTIVVANGKGNIPFFIRVLNAFDINYVIMHDSDIKPGMNIDAENTAKTANQKIASLAKADKLIIFPIKLEETVGIIQHFKDQYDTLKFFSDHTNINSELERIITSALDKLEIKNGTQQEHDELRHISNLS